MSRCTHNDCFTCPYKDCISETGPKGTGQRRKKLSSEEVRKHKAETNKRYYYKNREKISALHRKYYQEKKKDVKDGA